MQKCGKIELTRVGRLLQSIIMPAYAIPRSQINWNAERVMVMMIAGGTAGFAAIFIIYASLCFFTLEGLEFMNVLTDGAQTLSINRIITQRNGPFSLFLPARG